MRPFFIMIVSLLASLGCADNKKQKQPQVVKSSQEKNVKAEAPPGNPLDELDKKTVDVGNNQLFLANIPRDPFSSSQHQQMLLGDLEKEENFCEDLLCGFEIGQLSLVAVMSGDASPVAMLEDTQGVGYIVRKSTRIGRRGGRISSIYQNCLVVSEPSQDIKSGVKDITLCVKSEDMNSMSVDLMNNRQIQ